MDFARPDQAERLPAAHTLIHLAPIATLPDLLPDFFAQGGSRVIAFSTTSRDAKAASGSADERAFASTVRAAEEATIAACERAQVPWTVLRPTLIYGAGRDRNVMVIARVIRRFGVFPVFGAARGLRQPVHVDDLAAACLAALDSEASHNKDYTLSGGETLSYRDMVARIFVALGKVPRFIEVPLAVFGCAMWLVSRLKRFRDFNPEMARRMNEDLVFDHAAARRDLGFSPRRFEPASGLKNA
jgi:nucleoside-diphosphate-sugar epimerase